MHVKSKSTCMVEEAEVGLKEKGRPRSGAQVCTWRQHDEARTRVGIRDLARRIHEVARRSVLGFAGFS